MSGAATVLRGAMLAGIGLSVLYTLLISGADAITKFIAGSYAAPQLFALSGGAVALLCLVAAPRGARAGVMRTRHPRAMAIRAVATVAGTAAFFHAFRLLPFAEVFLFIALIPIFAALLSGLVLGERPRPRTWGALILGSAGVACLFPTGLSSFGAGHLVALAAVLLGTVSLVVSRYIGQREDNLLAQIFYPNLVLMGVMALALPFVFRPMPPADLGWALAYAGVLFAARWVLVGALRLLPAYVVTPLMNLQFLWMVGIGLVVFGEMPGSGVYVGAAIIAGAGLWLIWEQARPGPRPAAAAVPAE